MKLEIPRGAVVSYIITVRNTAGDLEDLTGATIKYTARTTADISGTIVIEKSSVTAGEIDILDQMAPATLGKARLSFVAIDTEGETVDTRFYHDVWAKLSDGRVDQGEVGTTTVTPRTTTDPSA